MRGEESMTTFEAIEKLIDENIIRDEKTAKEIIFNAYYSGRIDGAEYIVLVDGIARKLKK